MHTDLQTTDRRAHKHSVYMPPETWELANSTARSLGLSTSQLLSRLVLEAVPLIRPGSLFGLHSGESIPTSPNNHHIA